MTVQSIHQSVIASKQGKAKISTPRLPIALAMLLSLVAGLVFSFSLAPYYLWPLAIFSVMGVYALLINEMSTRRAFWIGQAYGFGVWVVGASWLYNSIHEYGNVPAWAAAVMIGLMALIMGLFHAVSACVFVRFLGRQPLAFASLWVVQEWLKTWVLSGFPWLFVGYAFTEQSWISGIAPVLGVFGISFVVVLFAASVVELFYQKVGFLVLSILAILVGFVLQSVDWVEPDGRTLSVSLVQGNISQDMKWLTDYQTQTLEIYDNLTKSEWGRDVVVWPEVAIPMFHDEAMPFLQDMAKQAHDSQSSWITGLLYRDLKGYDENKHAYPPIYNSVAAIDATGDSLYRKQQLVPFGEYIPFEGMLNILPNLDNMQGLMSISRGHANQSPLAVKDHTIGAAICYEVAYPDTTRHNAKNADVLVTVSNDAWFGTTAGPWQHLQIVQMRSLETGRYFMRATNTGVTAIINHKGGIDAIVPQFERTVLRGEVPSLIGVTPFVRFGSYPILALALLLIVFSFVARKSSISSSRTQRYYTAKGVRD
ncbi:apolipoprotein N-acyltransferase [Moraxella haemolytica]|uniref:apolipoprotein N-acyltransferase n=1 Tax=Moraxella haemolytica TaxID=2904119 RepID=UPI002542CD8F|nr:apolipoprotein N-acyltransferase [Moraxella sp. ZY171148]WII95054.1 apolipoprotein N-acyltransferase [Moraxella sp. ZY171148]